MLSMSVIRSALTDIHTLLSFQFHKTGPGVLTRQFLESPHVEKVISMEELPVFTPWLHVSLTDAFPLPLVICCFQRPAALKSVQCH